MDHQELQFSNYQNRLLVTILVMPILVLKLRPRKHSKKPRTCLPAHGSCRCLAACTTSSAAPHRAMPDLAHNQGPSHAADRRRRICGSIGIIFAPHSESSTSFVSPNYWARGRSVPSGAPARPRPIASSRPSNHSRRPARS